MNKHSNNALHLITFICLFNSSITFAEIRLFSEIDQYNQIKQLDTSGKKIIIRDRFVKINISLLTNHKKTTRQHLKEKKIILFNLFNDTQFNVFLEKIETPGIGKTLIWHGRIQNMKNSSVIMAITEGIVMGNIRTDKGDLYRIKYMANDIHSIQLIDESQFPAEAEPVQEIPK